MAGNNQGKTDEAEGKEGVKNSMRKQLKRWYQEWPPRKGQSGEKVPHFCKTANEWRCMTGNSETRGNIEHVLEELTMYCESYDYLVRENQLSEDAWHEHFYQDVLTRLIQLPENFSVEGFEEQYSRQQIELIKAVREKLLAMGKKNDF